MLTLTLLLSAAAVSPVPPPLPQDLADCEHPTYASDQFICSNEQLLALDRQLRVLLPVVSVAGNLTFEDQQAWFKRSRLCASRADQEACLRAAYRERIAVVGALQRLLQEPPVWQPIKCGRRQSEYADLGRGMVSVRWDARVILANTATELGSWTPFAWARTAGKKLEIRTLDGLKLRCTAIAR